MPSEPSYRFCPMCARALQDQICGGVSRRACVCGFIHWDNPIPVVAALVRYRDAVVLARNAAWPPQRFSLITGFLEKTETPAQAAAREVKEELGLDSNACAFIGHYIFSAQNQVILAFAVNAVGAIALGDEIAEVRLIPQNELAPRDLAGLPISAQIVADWLATAQLPRTQK